MPIFDKVNFLIINSTDVAKSRGMLLFTINDVNERDAFVAKESQIQIGENIFKAEAHKKDKRLVAIRLPIQFDAKNKVEISKELRQGLTEYFSKNYADAFDFKKPIDTVSLNPNHPDSPLENTVYQPLIAANNDPVNPNPVPAAVLAVIAAAPVENGFKKALANISNLFNDFIKAPSKHPALLGMMGAIAAVSFGLPTLAVLAVGASIVAATKLRNHVYNKDNVTAPKSPEMINSYHEGYKAGASWTTYFNSYASKNTWIRPLCYGSGLADGMKAQENPGHHQPRHNI